jgi:predicted  nucleic acid-binding Zn-ribbon protein
MQNENDMLQGSQADAVRDEIEQMRESIELARSDIRRTKKDIEQYQGEHESHVRRTWALWVIVILLVVGAAGFWWYESRLLEGHQALLGNMPVLQSTLNNVNTRVMATEHEISDWAKDRAGFSDRISKLEESVGSNLKTVRNEARLMGQQIKNETAKSVQALQNRVTGVESIQREHSEEVARLRNELTGVRQELASVREENVRQANEISSKIEQVQQSTRNDLSGLDRRLGSNQAAVNALGRQVDRKRVDFQLQNGHTQQVVDGIYVTVKNTDVERQRVDGWVQIASDGRFVWLHGQGAQNPIDFSSRRDARPDQLVFTQVGRNHAAGYILVPITNSGTPAAAN